MTQAYYHEADRFDCRGNDGKSNDDVRRTSTGVSTNASPPS